MTIPSQCQQGETPVQLILKDLPPVIFITQVLEFQGLLPPLVVKLKVSPVLDGVKDCYIECKLRTKDIVGMVPMTLLVPILGSQMGSILEGLLVGSNKDIAHFSTKGNTHVVLLMGVWSPPPGLVTILAWTMPRTLRLCNRRFCQFEVA